MSPATAAFLMGLFDLLPAGAASASWGRRMVASYPLGLMGPDSAAGSRLS
jgi:hypothetical protein